MSHIAMRGISKRYDGTNVIANVGFEVKTGEIMGIIGPSGAGKTTLIKIIAGLEKPSDGEIYFDGEDGEKLSPKERGIAILPQRPSILPWGTVFQNIAFDLEIDGRLTKAEIKKEVFDIAEKLSIAHLLERYPQKISGGERQRVALAGMLVGGRRVLLFDEPLAQLDAPLRDAMLALLRSVIRLKGATAFYITHDQWEAAGLADRIVVVSSKGHIEQIGTYGELYNSPATLFVAQFVGDPAMNILPAESLTNFFGPLFSEESVMALQKSNQGPQGLVIGFRPETLILSPLAPSRSNILGGKVINVRPTGREDVVSVLVCGTRVLAYANPGLWKIGMEACLNVDSRSLYFFDKKTGVRIV